MQTTTSLDSLQQRRAQIADQITALGDLRAGSITPTSGRCGKPTCHCHQLNDPGHGPNPRLTYKVDGKTVTQSLPNPAAMRKAEREIAEFRNLQSLHREFVEVNAQDLPIAAGGAGRTTRSKKTLSKRSSRKPSAK